MTIPVVQQLAKKASGETPNKVYSLEDVDFSEPHKPDPPTWSVWKSGLVVAVISGFLFPFLGVPAVIVAIFAYVDLKSDDWEGYKRRGRVAVRLAVISIILGLIMMGGMYACKKWRKHHYSDMMKWAQTAQPYCHRPFSDCYGRDIRYVKGVNLRQCQIECDVTSDCVSIQHTQEHCWMKEHVCAASELRFLQWGHDYVKMTPEVNCTDLTREYKAIRDMDYCSRPGVTCAMSGHYCHRPDSDCVGNDIRHVNANLDECQKECDEDTRCVSIQQRDLHCWLKTKVCNTRELTMATGRHDYVKKQNGGNCTGL